MRKVDQDRFRTSAPSLGDVLADQRGVDTAVVTIKEVSEQTFPPRQAGGAERIALVIRTEEFPDNAYFPSSGRGGALDRLFKRLGNDLDAWIGEKIPLVRVRDVTNPQTHEKSDKFHVAPAEEWDTILAEFDKAQRGAARAAKPAARRK